MLQLSATCTSVSRTGRGGSTRADHLKAVGLPTRISDIKGSFDTGTLLAHMAQDKKVSDGQITFILASAIGKVFASKEVSLDIIAKVLETSINNS